MTDKVYLDANILIAHQVSNHQYHTRAMDIIDRIWKKRHSFVISSLTWDEFFYGLIFILQSVAKDKTKTSFDLHTQVISEATEKEFSWERLELVEFRHNPTEVKIVLKNMQRYNLRPRDAFHLCIMQQQNIRQIATFDHDFNRIKEKGGLIILG